MPTQKQIEANRANAKLSTGPKTAAGKEASAANAMTHGMTAEKYLTNSESVEEFEAEYVARRKLYPPNDPIIDKLVCKITLAHFRVDRGFEAEVEMIDNANDSLAQVLVQYDKPMKHLTGYEASNRRTLKLLEEELERYVSMLKENGATDGIDEPDPTPPKPKGPSPKRMTKADTREKAPASPTPTSATADQKTQAIAAGDSKTLISPPAATSVSRANSPLAAATSSVSGSPPTPAVGEIAKTKPKPKTDGRASTSTGTVPNGSVGEISLSTTVSLASPSPPSTPMQTSLSGNQTLVSRPAKKSMSRSATTPTLTSSREPVPPPMSARAENPKANPISSGSAPVANYKDRKTDPISTGGCSSAEPTTNATKIIPPAVETWPSPLTPTETATPIEETCPDVAITGAPELEAPLTAVPPSSPQPMWRSPHNFDLNNWSRNGR